MLISVSERQSGSPPIVFDDTERRKVELLSQRLKHLMEKRGWNGREGISILADAIGEVSGKRPRWQTVQYWVEGRLTRLPHHTTIEHIAAVFDMNVEELLGIAIGEDPTNNAWAAFLETDEGRSMNAEERRHVARRSFGDREPTVMAYTFELYAYRAARAPAAKKKPAA